MPQAIRSPRRIVRCMALCLLACLCLRASAQEPTDSEVWKSRCLSLGAHADAIDKGSAPPELLQSTHGTPGAKFAAVGYERGNAGQHYIACTLYYTAALAEHLGNGGKIDPGRAHTDIVLAGAEAKRAAGLPLTFKEKMDRASGKLNPAGKTSLTPADLSAVYAAFGDGAPSPPNSWGNGGQTPAQGGYDPNPPMTPSSRGKDTPPKSPSQGRTPWKPWQTPCAMRTKSAL